MIISTTVTFLKSLVEWRGQISSMLPVVRPGGPGAREEKPRAAYRGQRHCSACEGMGGKRSPQNTHGSEVPPIPDSKRASFYSPTLSEKVKEPGLACCPYPLRDLFKFGFAHSHMSVIMSPCALQMDWMSGSVDALPLNSHFTGSKTESGM